MKLVTIDFETYFDADYSLRKLTTEEYVRDGRFQVHCMGIHFPDAPALWMRPGSIGRLRADLAECAVLCHHTHFDGLILAHHFGIRPTLWLDTLSMARMALPHIRSHSLEALADRFHLAPKSVPYNEFKGVRELSPGLEQRLGDGAAHDCKLTYTIFKRLLPLIPRSELLVIDKTIRMFTEPRLMLDAVRCRQFRDDEAVRKTALLVAAGVTADDMQSSAKFVKALESVGHPCPMKESPSVEGKMIPAIAKNDAAMAALCEHPDERVQALAEARLAVKSTIGGTRSARMLSMAGRGAMPVYLAPNAAHTFRWGGGDAMNWQNLPPDLRKCVVAPEGHKIVSGDLGQIECRVLNRLAGQWDVLDAFASGRDIYSENATAFYDRQITKANKAERQLGKTIELACGFGMGSGRFQETCRQGPLGGDPIYLELPEAAAAVKQYRDTHRAVGKLWKAGEQSLSYLAAGSTGKTWCDILGIEAGYLMLPNGARMDYSALHRSGDNWKLPTRRGDQKIYGAKLVENVVQGVARVIMSDAALRIAKAAPEAHWVLTVHDELVYVVADDQAEVFGKTLHDELVRCPVWWDRIPLSAEVSISRRYDK